MTRKRRFESLPKRVLWTLTFACVLHPLGGCGSKDEELEHRPKPVDTGVVPTTVPTIPCPSVTPNARASENAASNDIDPAFLRPLVLDDRVAMEAYLASLPPGVYKEYTVKHLGKFYLDSGRDVIKSVLRRGSIWEGHIIKTLRQHIKAGTTVIDAGAHIGTHAISMSQLVGADGRVYAFEPQKKVFRELVYNMRLNGLTNVIPLRYALGDTAGTIDMALPIFENEGGTGVGTGGDKAELRTIDSFPFRNVSVIKIDVEGFEDHVLDGARLTILRWRPVIVIEIQGGQSYEKAPPEVRAKIDATRAKLTSFGYRVDLLRGHDYLAVPSESQPPTPSK